MQTHAEPNRNYELFNRRELENLLCFAIERLGNECYTSKILCFVNEIREICLEINRRNQVN